MNTLTQVTRDAADLIRECGWTTGTFEAPNGALCLHGAVRACSQQPGDGFIVSAVMTAHGHPTKWNDEQESLDSVLTYLSEVTITDAMLAVTFGPQWETIVALVRQAATLTDEQAKELSGIQYAAWDISWSAARNAARDTERDATWNAAWYAASDAAGYKIRNTVRDAVRSSMERAAGYTAMALIVADIVGQHGLEQHHIDMFLAPWISIVGDPRELIASKEKR